MECIWKACYCQFEGKIKLKTTEFLNIKCDWVCMVIALQKKSVRWILKFKIKNCITVQFVFTIFLVIWYTVLKYVLFFVSFLITYFLPFLALLVYACKKY